MQCEYSLGGNQQNGVKNARQTMFWVLQNPQQKVFLPAKAFSCNLITSFFSFSGLGLDAKFGKGPRKTMH